MGCEDRQEAVAPTAAEVGDGLGQVGDLAVPGIDGDLGGVHRVDLPLSR